MSNFPALDCQQILFRAVLLKDWIRPDRSIKWQAFKRFRKDYDGVSLFFSRQGAVENLREPYFGLMSVHVGRIREINLQGIPLDVIRNEPEHAYIHEVPCPDHIDDEDEKLRRTEAMRYLCDRIAKEAARLIPEGE